MEDGLDRGDFHGGAPNWSRWEAGTVPTGCQDGTDGSVVVKPGAWLDSTRKCAAELNAERRAKLDGLCMR
ncbi:hypothetical protein ACFC5Z_04280 [Streptomyces sp. NPDC056004]|uniref:hypothetical protein n=1 Tax=unclassified Streptomyces TaxID=2593676 RepID=UPI0035DA76B0